MLLLKKCNCYNLYLIYVAVREPLSTAYVISGAGKPTSGRYFLIYIELPSSPLQSLDLVRQLSLSTSQNIFI